MIKAGVWQYLEAVIDRKKSVELKGMIGGGYAACINGFHFGVGDSAREAFLDAARESKRRRKFDAR